MAKIFLGVLSGTSLDAIDVGAFSFQNQQATLHHTLSYPFPTAIKQACMALTETTNCNLAQLGQLDKQLGLLFATAVQEFLIKHNLSGKAITAIGCHGQTVYHSPSGAYPFTLQLGDPNVIAEKTGITTIADFRRMDMAVGGQGAPLAPGFHAAIFRCSHIDRVIINIGGISNISVLPKDCNLPIVGFDTGPGNCLLDSWVQHNFGKPYDKNGTIATNGKMIEPLLDLLLQDPYFALPIPKSTGREYFNMAWLQTKLLAIANNYSPADILATLVNLTSRTISQAILANISAPVEIYVCGGGSYNCTLQTALQIDLQQTVKLTTELGIAPDWVEAGLFAWLAQQRLLRLPGNIPSVTGANKAAVLGGIYV